MDKGAWWAIDYGVAESEMTERLIHLYIIEINPSL